MSEIHDLLLIHHSHTDIGYTHHQDSVFAWQREYIRRAIQLAERYADGAEGERFRWTCEATIIVEDFLRHAKASEIDRLRQVHQAGLIDFGAMYCHFTPLVTLEMLAQSLSVAQRLRQDYGFDIRHGLACDVNGLPWGLVELLLDSGVAGMAMAINRVMARDPQPRPVAFQWQGPSGRTIPVWHGEHYGFGHLLGIPRVKKPDGWVPDLDEAQRRVQTYVRELAAKGVARDFTVLQITSTFQWDNGGPHEELVHFVREWNRRGWQPRLHLAGLADVFARVRDLPDLPVRAGDWTDWWAQGVGSTAYEVALARRSHERLGAARVLATLLRAQAGESALDATADEAAWRALALFDEHTWGSFDSVTHAGGANARGQLHKKLSYAYDGAAAATRAAQSALRDLAARLPQQQAPHVCIFNPLPWPRRVPLLLPAVSHTGWELDRLEYRLEIGSAQADSAARVDYGLVDLPAGGYLSLPLRLSDPLPLQRYTSVEGSSMPIAPPFVPAPAPGLMPTEGVILDGWRMENRFYCLTLDSTTGAITRLIDKRTGREWVDRSVPFGLGGYVLECSRSPRQRRDMQLQFDPPFLAPDHDRRPALAFERRGPQRVLDVQPAPGVGGARLCLRIEAPGVDSLHVQVALYDDMPWIDLVYDIDKLPSVEMESAYIAFPFALRSPVARYDAAGAIVEAGREQIDIACRDFYAVQRWVDLSDVDAGVTVAMPDAPMVLFGGFTHHAFRTSVAMEQPYLVSWPMNNHWWTNFALTQSGWARFRYRLLFHEGPFDAAQAERFGAEACVEPLITPVFDRPAGMAERAFSFAPHLPAQATLLQVEPATVRLAFMRPEGASALICLQEVAGVPTTWRVDLAGGAIDSAEACDALGRGSAAGKVHHTETRLSGEIAARALQYIRVHFAVHAS